MRRVGVGNLLQQSTTTPIVTITQINRAPSCSRCHRMTSAQEAMEKGRLMAIAYGRTIAPKLGQGNLVLVNNTINTGLGAVQLKATSPNGRADARLPGAHRGGPVTDDTAVTAGQYRLSDGVKIAEAQPGDPHGSQRGHDVKSTEPPSSGAPSPPRF